MPRPAGAETARAAVRVIVTRPAAQAAEWVVQLRAHGVDAVALPLIEIAPASTAADVVAAWRALARQRLVVFVSPSAAEQFFAQRPSGTAWPGATWAGSPGPGTTRALRALGVAAARIIEPASDAAQFDSQALWAQLEAHDWRSAQVLIVRGEGGRDWLATQLRAHGASVANLPAYRRVVPVFDAAQRTLMQEAVARPAAWAWFFSSSEAVDTLAAVGLCGAADAWPRSSAIATHPRIAAHARELGFARVCEARPTLAAVVACIQSIQP